MLKRVMYMLMSIVMASVVIVPACAWGVEDEFGIETDVYVENRDGYWDGSSSSSSSGDEDEDSNSSPALGGSAQWSSGSTLAKTGWWLLDHWWMLFVVGGGLVIVGVVRERRVRK